jgi:hypothetical protein
MTERMAVTMTAIAQGEVDDQIVQDIEHWEAGAKERRLTLLKKAPAINL